MINKTLRVKGVRCDVSRELSAAIRFSLVGLLATLVHGIAAAGLIVYASLDAFAANLFAFMVAFAFSFVGHYRWTFRAQRVRKFRALLRFFVVAAIAFLSNNVILMALLARGVVDDLSAVLISISVIPAVSFFAGRFWAYSPDPASSREQP